MLRSLIHASNVGSSSFIVAIFSIPRTSGSSPSPASCASARSVRICVPHEPAMKLRAETQGIVLVYQSLEPAGITWSGLPYYLISLSLNILLTLTIVIRLTVHQKHLCRPGDDWNRWIVQGRRHHARQVLCNYRCELVLCHWTLGRRRKPHCEFLLAHPLSDSGLSFSTTAAFGQVG